MNLYLVSQDENRDYESYDSFVCQANSEREARHMLPETYKGLKINYENRVTGYRDSLYDDWIRDVSKITVKYLGISTDISGKPKMICASFNAG